MQAGSEIGIPGCGWLGLRLARVLISSGHKPIGTTTRIERLPILENIGVLASRLILEPDLHAVLPESLLTCDYYILTLPPGRTDDVETTYPKKIARFLEALLARRPPDSIGGVAFVSSTAVYPDSGEIVDETTPPDPVRATGRGILAAERLLENAGFEKLWVFRSAGLIGSDRRPSSFLKRETSLTGGENPVNLITGEDAARLIAAALRKGIPSGIYNLVAPSHPSRKDFYTQQRHRDGLPFPEFREPIRTPSKIVDGSRILEATGISLHCPDLMEFRNESMAP